MTTHNTPRHAPNQTGPEAAEPARRASRFDERGIALQTVIIMVVLLAIFGAIAAVLLARGEKATTQLEQSAVTNVAQIYKINNESICQASNGLWASGGHSDAKETDINVDLDGDGTLKATPTAKCKPR